ncbi:group IV decarboxylase [Cavenderia fasciculata]|uniref:ornithine decarboxylase n=1 Tax=Cavenderia fasciculata TaxID=261658 RepID=F4Q0X6_CACFS|nr:group IV decarboxylase [Cavenderia fasciculata]EGG18477.1 group IV decarboxylase [Cavenderia fasciculata]|eukprot:XP_004366381.1 group IV decarboxylase [Cavenderia fasciculata]
MYLHWFLYKASGITYFFTSSLTSYYSNITNTIIITMSTKRSADETTDATTDVVDQQQTNGSDDSHKKQKSEVARTSSKLEKLAQVKKDLDVKEWSSNVTLEELLTSLLDKSERDAFFVADIATIIKQYQKWIKHLPHVTPYYAVKCNPTQGVLKVLEALGTSFDCASRNEIETVLNLGVDPSRIIYANPCKQISALKFARLHNVKMMTFDNVSELEKIEKFFPEAELVLRIAPDDSKSLMRFGTKFGVHIDDCSDLLEMAKEMNLKVVGVSFHVGSGCFDASAYDAALEMVKSVFDMAKTHGMTLNLVDIGGGFTGSDDVMFGKFTDAIRNKTKELFAPDVRIIAEPGRYFAAMSHVLAVTVISKRIIKQEDNRQHPRRTSNNLRQYNYYLADGVYGSFNNIQFDHAKPTPCLLKPSHKQPTPCTLFGPTCDSIDVIARDTQIPELKIGDWLYFKDMGAYTMASASSFNGFVPPPIYYYCSEIDTSDL